MTLAAPSAMDDAAPRDAPSMAPGNIDPAPFVRTGANGMRILELAVSGARCAGCLRKIESGVGALAGVSHARLNLTTGQLKVEWQGNLAPAAITDMVRRLGYPCAPFDPRTASVEIDREGRKLLTCLAVAAFAAGNVMLFSIGLWTAGVDDMGSATRNFFHWASAAIALPASVYAGRPFFFSAWRALKAGHANMDVPISLAVLLSLAMSLQETLAGGRHAYFDAAVSLLFLLLVGRYLDHRLRYRAGEAARHLLTLQSVSARRVEPNGHVVAIAASDVRVGDSLLIAPGDRVPVDATIKEGASEFDLALLTGESTPVTLGPNASVPGGALNLTGRIVAEATARAQDSLAAELARLIDAGAQSRSKYVRLADRAAALYVPIVHTLAALTLLGWWLVIGADLRLALNNAIAVLIITCPCALGLAVPAVQIVATGALFRRGVLVKSGDALERMSEIDTIVLDKTGTLTRGAPELAPGKQPDRNTLEHAAHLARLSRHPLAKAIVSVCGPGPVATGVREVAGAGISGEVDGAHARLGNREFVTGIPGAGGMELWFRRGAEAPVRIACQDALRADAPAVIGKLAQRGLRLEMASGDSEAATRDVASALGIAASRARQAPKDKIARLEQLAGEGRRVLMVGDGLNDAPSLAKAFVSMSPSTAADASQAAADFVFQGERLRPVLTTIEVARRARARVFENFAFAALYNLCVIPIAVLGLVTPFIAAIAMSASSLIVTLNALRLAGHETHPS